MGTHQIVSGGMPAGDGTIPNPGRSNNFDGNNSHQYSNGQGLLAMHPDGRVAIVGGFWTDSSDVNFPAFFNSNTVQVSTDSILTSWNTYHDTDFSETDITHNAFGSAQNVVMSVSGSNDILIVVFGLDHAIRFAWNTGIFTNTTTLGGPTLKSDVVPIQLNDGRIFVGTASDNNAYLYHPGTDSWESFTAYSGDHTGGGSALLSDGNILLVGGATSGGNHVEVLKVSDLSWHSPVADLNTNRQLFAFTQIGTDIFLLAGGLDISSSTLSSCEIVTYTSPTSATALITGSLAVGRYGPMPSFLLPGGSFAAVFGGIAGLTFTSLNSIELYDVGGGTWSTDNATLTQINMGFGGLLISSSPMKFWMPGGETFDAGVLTFDRIVQTADMWEDQSGSTLIGSGNLTAGANTSLNAVSIVNPCWNSKLQSLTDFELRFLNKLDGDNLDLLRLLILKFSLNTTDDQQACRAILQMAFETEIQSILEFVPFTRSIATTLLCDRRKFIDIDRDLIQYKHLYSLAVEEAQELYNIPEPYGRVLLSYMNSAYSNQRIGSVCALLCFVVQAVIEIENRNAILGSGPVLGPIHGGGGGGH